MNASDSGDLPRSKGNKVWKAWDWDKGRLMLCAIAGYEGAWYGASGGSEVIGDAGGSGKE